jgi:phosphotransacetylase/acyl dehydratase
MNDKPLYNIDHNKDIKVLVNYTYDELQLGQKVAIKREVTHLDIELFAIVSGDINPAHFDEGYAKRDIFHDIVAHGMLSGAFISTILGTRLPGPGTIYLKQSLQFHKPVKVNDVIEVQLEVKEKKADSRVVLSCVCTNQDGVSVVTGIAEVIAPSEKIVFEKPQLPMLEILEPGRFCKEFINKAKAIANKPKVAVVYPCSENALLGAVEAYQNDLMIPILLGPADIIKQIAADYSMDLSGMEIIDIKSSVVAAEEAVLMVHQGKADLLMKGSLHTGEFLKAIIDPVKGLRTENRISHCCVMDIPNYDRPLLISDIAVNIAPDLMEKKDIIQNAIGLAHAIGIELPKVALLSAEELVSPKMTSSIDAAILCKMAERGQIKGAILDGPLAFDVALSKVAADIKQLKSAVSGSPDILIAPSIEAANILAKEFKYFTLALMPGLVLGAKVPAILTSRSDDALTRVTSCALAALYVNYFQNK